MAILAIYTACLNTYSLKILNKALADGAGEHHLRNRCSLRICHPQAINENALLSHLRQQRGYLLTATVDDYRIEAEVLQHRYIADNGFLQLCIHHC